MAQYIDKDAVVAEIGRYKHKADERLKIKGRTLAEDWKDSALQNLCGNLLHFLDAIEVKEVDLEEAIDDYIYTHDGRKRLALELDWKCCNLTLKGGDEIIKFAKHFYELGMSVSNKV